MAITLPVLGSSGWGHVLNDALSQLDTDVSGVQTALSGVQTSLADKIDSLDYDNAAPGTRFTMPYNGTTGFINPATGNVAGSRPSSRTDIYFDLIGGSNAVADPAWMIGFDAREITS